MPLALKNGRAQRRIILCLAAAMLVGHPARGADTDPLAPFIDRIILSLAAAMLVGHPARGANTDPLAPFIEAIAQLREQFRIEGLRGPTLWAALGPIADGLRALADRSTGPLRARALLELGRTQRMATEFTAAIATLTDAAASAAAERLTDTEFDAWMNVARAHVLTHQFGEADDAIDRAAAVAGDLPSRKQQFDLADLRSFLYETRGEAETAVTEAVATTRLTSNAEQRYYANFNLADALEKIFSRCENQALVDSESQYDSDPRWGACARAMAATRAAFQRTRAVAHQNGWRFLAQEAGESADRVERLYQLWAEHDAQTRRDDEARGLFKPGDTMPVLVTQYWPSASIADLPQAKAFVPLIEQVMAEHRRAVGEQPDAGILGLLANKPGTRPAEVADRLRQAAAVIEAERHSYFDARRRGTSTEEHTDIMRNLPMQFLSLGQQSDAFTAFESIRARGLGELNQALAQPEVTPATRQWLASLLLLEARASQAETRLVRKLIATGDPTLVYDQLDALQAISAERRMLLVQGGAELERLKYANGLQPAKLADLQAAATAANVAVLLYWADHAILVAWYVGPHGSQVRNVFLPEWVMQERVTRIRDSAARAPSAGTSFDREAARDLTRYLIDPFKDLLDTGQIMIVPQGPLIGLPFETLLLPGTDSPLIERFAISYAPNATMALRALRRTPRPIGRTVAFFDPEIDEATHESAGLRTALGPKLRKLPLEQVIPAAGTATASEIGNVTALHLLLHGRFDFDEPLLSRMVTQDGARSFSAAELVGLPLRDLRLAVLSGCETGLVGVRLSNEIYGFPWALLAGGVDAAVVSRWQVQGVSNGKWMQRFYAAMVAGQSPAEAAATAMRGLRREPGYDEPYYWAAMQVSGR